MEKIWRHYVKSVENAVLEIFNAIVWSVRYNKIKHTGGLKHHAFKSIV